MKCWRGCSYYKWKGIGHDKEDGYQRSIAKKIIRCRRKARTNYWERKKKKKTAVSQMLKLFNEWRKVTRFINDYNKEMAT